MKILGLLWKNLRRGVATLRFPRRRRSHRASEDWCTLTDALYRMRDVPIPLHRSRHHLYGEGESSSSGLTIPHSARFAADAWMDVKIML